MAVFDSPSNWRLYKVLPKLALARALHATGRVDDARKAIEAARQHIRAASESIGDSVLRRTFLSAVPDNVRVLELCREWGVAP
jgi:hypothetical protein